MEAAIRKGRPLPDWYEDEPLLDFGDIFYIKAFYDLGTCRQSSMELGPIPWTAMITYVERYQLEWDVAEAFVDIIREMDIVYIKDHSAKQKRRQKMNKAKNKKG